MAEIKLIDDFLDYISGVRRYSPRTLDLYSDALSRFAAFVGAEDGKTLVESLKFSLIRSYEVHLADKEGLSPKTVSLHLSALRSFCRYLLRRGIIKSNPAAQVKRPKVEKRLPEFFRQEAMEKYFAEPRGTDYMKVLSRAVIATLYGTGMRRAELIGLNIDSVNFARKVIRVHGKGDKVREIPLVDTLSEELSLYLQQVESMTGRERSHDEPLFVTPSKKRMYPVFVDRMIKSELATLGGVTERKSPHVFRHTLATELLDDGADLHSIKDTLGHSSLAATQIYTHATIEQLRKVYLTAHPRATKHRD
ncbi:MAG: tyrosine-type recombinase/integrase [Bacteroidales bacterium]|nr:tyrosine-type recombinase/integrase [Bacteroidales bacterium]